MIVEIEKETIEELNNSFISSEIINDFMNNPFGKMLVLKENNEIIGFIYYSDIYERAEINQFEIKKIHRNCGKGKILLTELLKKTKKPITLEVKEDNYSAIHLYEKNGFEKKAVRKGYYHGTDGILMERSVKHNK